ncbi:MAG: hypothetical protein QW231_05535 [Candidatus Bathyarchaeia archaeon]
MDITTYFTVIMNILMVLIIIALFLAFFYMVYGSEGKREKEKAPS